jgi:hypothetical protein
VGKAYKGFPHYLLMGITYRGKNQMNNPNIEDEITPEIKKELEKINSYSWFKLE